VASLGLLVRQMEIWYPCYTQHRLNFIFPSGSFSFIRQLPFRFSEMARHRIRLWRMKGECGVFANSLKRIGKWRRLAFATGLADFNAEAKWQMIFKICWPLKKFHCRN
jgi:hypothetical protein